MRESSNRPRLTYHICHSTSRSSSLIWSLSHSSGWQVWFLTASLKFKSNQIKPKRTKYRRRISSCEVVATLCLYKLVKRAVPPVPTFFFLSFFPHKPFFVFQRNFAADFSFKCVHQFSISKSTIDHPCLYLCIGGSSTEHSDSSLVLNSRCQSFNILRSVPYNFRKEKETKRNHLHYGNSIGFTIRICTRDLALFEIFEMQMTQNRRLRPCQCLDYIPFTSMSKS